MQRNPIRVLVLWCLSLLFCVPAWSQSSIPPAGDPPDVFAPTTSWTDISDYLKSKFNAGDYGEGKAASHLRYMDDFWHTRGLANDASANAATNTNMFTKYFRELNAASAARQAQSCGTGGFQGAWKCIGPDTLPTQNLGKLDCVWGNPNDTMHIMVGGHGGLFETKNGGKTWKNLTDTIALANGILSVSWIAVDPNNVKNIYLGTSGEVYKALSGLTLGLQYSVGGTGILKSTDSGKSWTQENINSGDVIERVQRVVFTPDGSRLYALANNRVYTRTTNGGGWTNITPPLTIIPPPVTGNTWWDFTDIEFTPGNQNQFYVVARYLFNGKPNATILKSITAVPIATSWQKIMPNGFEYYPTAADTVRDTGIINICLSIPDADTLFALMMPTDTPDNEQGLLKWNITGTVKQWTRIATIPPQPPSDAFKIDLVVTPIRSNNNNRRIMYVGDVDALTSVDGGQSFIETNTYGGDPTHCDVRQVFLVRGTNTLNGVGDIVLYANDGGVSKKSSGRDPVALQTNTLININGRGLACGHFWGVDVSEAGGIALGGSFHNGKMAYEPNLIPQWVQLTEEDAYTTLFDKRFPTRAYGIAGFGTYDREVTAPAGGRLMGTTQGSTYPNEPGGNSKMAQFADINNNQYIGIKQLWTGNPGNDPTNIIWDVVQNPSGSGAQLPNVNTSRGVRALALSPYEFRKGYVLYNAVNYVDTQFLYYLDWSQPDPFKVKQLPVVPGTPQYNMTDICADPNNMQRVWVSQGNINNDLTNNVAHNRVRYSPDGGTNWCDVSKGLPLKMPVSNIVFHEGMNVLYCATDVGIYRCDFNSFNPAAAPYYGVEWTCFSKGANGGTDFPCTYVTQLKINYCEAKLVASTYGRAIWATDLLQDPGSTTNPLLGDVIPNPGMEIATNTTWSSERYLTSGVRIKNGATLTINNTGATQTVIHMPRNAAIIVDPGGRIIVDGARITHDCGGLWKGILVTGKPGFFQTTANQGTAIIRNNAVLEHARVAVANWGESFGPWWSNAGGIIQATNSTFRNNARGAAFGPYHNAVSYFLRNNVSFFERCSFLVDNDYRGENFNYPFLAGITMSDVEGVRVIGCTFTNSSTNVKTQTTGKGINAWNASFSVIPHCTFAAGSDYQSCNPASYTRNTFTGFGAGIDVNGSQTHIYNALWIDYATFDKNGVGVYVQNSNHFNVFHSTFHVGNGTRSYIKNCNCEKGIYATRSKQFRIEENSFTGYNISPYYFATFGAQVDSSGANANDLFKNTFAELRYAGYNVGDNAGNTPSGPVGLQYLCNTFTNNMIDHQINPVFTSIYQFSKGIRSWQGSAANPAGNYYSNAYYGTDFARVANNTLQPLYNYYNPAQTNNKFQVPGYYVPTYNVTTSNSPQCASRQIDWDGFNDIPFPIKRELGPKLIGYKNSWIAAKDKLFGRIDGSNTSGWLTRIDQSTTADNVSIHDDLLVISPYVSETVLRALAAKGVMPLSMMMDVFNANPEALRNGELMQYLKNDISKPFPSDAIAQLQTSSAATTARTADIDGVQENYRKMMLTAAELLTMLKTDSTGLDPDTLAAWYRQLPVLWARYDMAGHYLGSKDYLKLDQMLHDIPLEFSFTDAEQREYNTYVDFVNVIRNAQGAGRSHMELNESELSSLKGIVERNEGAGSDAALVIYQKGMGMEPYACDEPVDQPSNSRMYNGANPATNTTAKDADRVRAYPNPARDYVSFEYDFPATMNNKLRLVISNVSGTKVYERKLDGNRGSIWWDTRMMLPGTFLYQIVNDNKPVYTGKVVIIK